MSEGGAKHKFYVFGVLQNANMNKIIMNMPTIVLLCRLFHVLPLESSFFEWFERLLLPDLKVKQNFCSSFVAYIRLEWTPGRIIVMNI